MLLQIYTVQSIELRPHSNPVRNNVKYNEFTRDNSALTSQFNLDSSSVIRQTRLFSFSALEPFTCEKIATKKKRISVYKLLSASLNT